MKCTNCTVCVITKSKRSVYGLMEILLRYSKKIVLASAANKRTAAGAINGLSFKHTFI